MPEQLCLFSLLFITCIIRRPLHGDVPVPTRRCLPPKYCNEHHSSCMIQCFQNNSTTNYYDGINSSHFIFWYSKGLAPYRYLSELSKHTSSSSLSPADPLTPMRPTQLLRSAFLSYCYHTACLFVLSAFFLFCSVCLVSPVKRLCVPWKAL